MAARVLAARLLQRWAHPSSHPLLRESIRSPVPVSFQASSMTTNRWLATSSKEDVKDEKTSKEDAKDEKTENLSKAAEGGKKNESFEETINRLRGEEGSNSGSSTSDFQRRLADMWGNAKDEVSLAWKELVESEQRKSINKKIHPVATNVGDKPYTGPVEVMVIDPSEQLTAWERMQKRLTDAPIIQDMLSRTDEFYDNSGARKAKERIDEIKEDAREAWDTSQNPWVYRASSVYDTLTADTAESIAVKELRKLDPEFTLEGWKRDVVEHTLPQIMQWFLEGRINQLKEWLGDGVFKRIAAEITARKQEGVEIDTHVLGIMNSEILAIEPDTVDKGSPIIMLHFMVQQINCVRKKKDGKITEGSPDDIRANSYVAAFQREYREDEGELVWKIIDFRFNGAIAYL
mmetsp:Transcript_8313/g.10898  ORF Transcript_8313/g.10898 Transcript_8313/m.10898 type:complete len:404 (+) Transcript_8313:77-1288(+)|eukprot:CAMPEP_0198149486 /NCGR_PEP_ID=MMETSP1443-20131203/46841_1 /TAXON_ID=186043 /ORGANISM="Entomoneis sp., Strain CCMP2396" /LENGTH=403 /DNA_ID=CAMNT_0043814543 /DNA_START=61 /DNA_END=1272 /DNA_ORIENTATION=+